MSHNLEALDDLPDSALLRPSELLKAKVWPGGRSSLWLAAREGRFPQPVKVGENTTAWRLGDIRAWQRSLTPAVQQEEVA